MAKKKAVKSKSSKQTQKKSARKELVPARGLARLDDVGLPDGYGPVLAELKTRVRSAQLKAAVSVNRELILLYWHIGSEILRCQNEQGWRLPTSIARCRRNSRTSPAKC